MQHVACVSFSHTLHLSNWQRLRNWIDLLPRIIYYLTFQIMYSPTPPPAAPSQHILLLIRPQNALLISNQKQKLLLTCKEKERNLCQ